MGVLPTYRPVHQVVYLVPAKARGSHQGHLEIELQTLWRVLGTEPRSLGRVVVSALSLRAIFPSLREPS